MSNRDVIVTRVPSLTQMIHLKVFKMYHEQRAHKSDQRREKNDERDHGTMVVGADVFFIVKEWRMICLQ
jgi:hypothetical protein